MQKRWRFKTAERKVHLIGDPHFNHDKDFLWGKRGYTSVQAHDEGLIQKWNETVGEEDDVLCPGDFIFNADYGLTVKYLTQLNGRIYLTWGNHNSGVKQIYAAEKVRFLTCLTDETSAQLLCDEFEVYPLTWSNPNTGEPKLIFCGDYMRGKIDHIEFVMMHYAIRTWDRMQKGAIHICGHSHGADKQSNPEWREGKRLDVAVETFGGPIEFYKAMEIFNNKQVVKTDHHSEDSSSPGF